MGIATDWTEDRHHRLYYGGTMPEPYLDDGFSTPVPRTLDDGAKPYRKAERDRERENGSQAWADAI